MMKSKEKDTGAQEETKILWSRLKEQDNILDLQQGVFGNGRKSPNI